MKTHKSNFEDNTFLVRRVDWLKIFTDYEVKNYQQVIDKLALHLKLPVSESVRRENNSTFSIWFPDHGVRIAYLKNDPYKKRSSQLSVEYSGLAFCGGINGGYSTIFSIQLMKLKAFTNSIWRAVNLHIATDWVGKEEIEEVLPNPYNPQYDYGFSHKIAMHGSKRRGELAKSTGFSLIHQRNVLTIYKKHLEIHENNNHQIKQLWFKETYKGQSVVRVELKLKTTENLSHLQKFIESPIAEDEFCKIALNYWAQTHKLTKKSSKQIENNFEKMFFHNVQKPKKNWKSKSKETQNYHKVLKEIRFKHKLRILIHEAKILKLDFEGLVDELKFQYDFITNENSDLNLSSDFDSCSEDKINKGCQSRDSSTYGLSGANFNLNGIRKTLKIRDGGIPFKNKESKNNLKKE